MERKCICYHCQKKFPASQAFGSGSRKFDYCSRECAVRSVDRIRQEHQEFLRKQGYFAKKEEQAEPLKLAA